MTMTKFDRLVLANQFAILEKLDPKEAEWYAQSRDVLESGYELMYGAVFRSISDDTMSEEQCEEVNRIMFMFSHLKVVYDELPDKSGVEEPHFEGFDGNGEDKELCFAQFCCDLRGGYKNIVPGEHVPNSHSARLGIYRRMLAVYDMERKDDKKLSKESLKKILAARVHADYR